MAKVQVGTTSVQILKLEPDLAEVSKVRSLVEEMGARSSLPPERIFDIQVAVSEAAANAIEHGNSEVQVILWRIPGQVIAEVSNVGHFRPRPRYVDEQAHGMGLGLMVSLADKVEIQGKERGKTTIRLWFKAGEVLPGQTQ